MIIFFTRILCLLFFSCNALYATKYDTFQTDNKHITTFMLQTLLNTKESEKVDLYLRNRPDNIYTFLQKNEKAVAFLSLYPQNNQEVYYELYTRPQDTDILRIALDFARATYPEAHKFTLSPQTNDLFIMTSFGNKTYSHK